MLALVGASTLLGLVCPFPLAGRLWSQIFDLAHAPVFCLLLTACAGLVDPLSIGLSSRFVQLRKLDEREIMLLAAGCLLLGCAGEFLQTFAGRNPSGLDLMADGAGILSGILWIRSRRIIGHGRLLLTLAASMVLASAMAWPAMGVWEAIRQRSDFPILASFERRNELGVWMENRSTIQRTTQWASDGVYSLRMDLSPGGFSGISMIWPVHDWRCYDNLKWDIHNTKATPLKLTVKIYDLRHTHGGLDPADRFELGFVVPPTTVHTLSLDLSAVSLAPKTRPMNMDQIARVELFTAELKKSHSVMLDNMRLVKKPVLQGIEPKSVKANNRHL